MALNILLEETEVGGFHYNDSYYQRMFSHCVYMQLKSISEKNFLVHKKMTMTRSDKHPIAGMSESSLRSIHLMSIRSKTICQQLIHVQ